MTQEQKNLLEKALEQKLEKIDIDLALVDVDGLLLEEHVKIGQLEKYKEQVLDYLYKDCEWYYNQWFKDDTNEHVEFDNDFIINEYIKRFYETLDVIFRLSEAYVTAKYTGYTKNIYVYDYNWKNYSDREICGVWFGNGQFFDVCELGELVNQGQKAWENRHN